MGSDRPITGVYRRAACVKYMPPVGVETLGHGPGRGKGTSGRRQSQVLASFEGGVDRVPYRVGNFARRPNQGAVNINANKRDHGVRLATCRWLKNQIWGASGIFVTSSESATLSPIGLEEVAEEAKQARA